ncbi:50S ribosomal protein L24 [Candidatus Daviesbacteria bacterium RIFCSPLOWO2_02_FULL_40_8]|uniref:Large ribosomal subunit protein uL24 n=1 Tax=Candidatus Daviesbacteria bacterium RIFCSPLOWO2_01_FULL_40_24 TaxID=1797787 RepID=A0A1F5MJW0_9BACT|nr:MAG: 50S ribosomal protein L24 [Candidatus Daviesbacteria bacterium RIFCSPHIGHO2_01_FULL_41_45]OGE35390.1 MAG: 50S ribosomal protein L24 [Candidatus Daviesbacteria bacterium RIFCSPHIGHO2_02_FULL_41_14]OGE65633.1 MAG: 50S ribosomal protein L24 [Candidatus Daviesbacteria bacterium RIFCSPLOWO2_01_FULL_40_24]OGE66312.1 MAG: 50S ribosomal protein L24 [Candidatus Daviesbacteria bacterium RIFCSPLOWO2_02_FULL_40_8]
MSKIKKDDQVEIMLGKDQGRVGKVLRVFPKEGKVLVEGINSYKKHVKGRQGVEGGIIDIIKPVDVSNVALVCKTCKKATRVGFKIDGESKLRICRKCQEVI